MKASALDWRTDMKHLDKKQNESIIEPYEISKKKEKIQ